MKNQSQVRRPPAQANRSGFTIVEVMIVMSVMAILLALALPNVRGVLARNQLLGQANELAAALQLARNEAVTRGVNAGVCPSANGTACGTEENWGEFIIVFADNDLDNVAADDEILRVFSGQQNQVTVDALGPDGPDDAPAPALVVFNNVGFSSVSGAEGNDIRGGRFLLCHKDEKLSENQRGRELVLRPSGVVIVRTVPVTVTKDGCKEMS